MTISYSIRTFLLFVSVFSTLVLKSQSDTASHLFVGDVFGIIKSDSLLSQNQFQTSISDFQEEDSREAPGTVFIISADQIQAMGTTDLMEVLAQIPSLNLGRDVDDAIGLSVRGLWAHEGKVLFMLNGIPLNEMDYGTFALGNRLSLDNVSRIEVMTGPGSVVYGGTAALGVINIITRTPLEMTGSKVSAESAISNGYLNRNTLSLTSNHKVGQNTFVSAHASFRTALRSTVKQYLNDSTYLSLGDSTATTDQNFYLGISRKNFRTQFLWNDYSYQVSDEPYSIQMKMFAWDNEWKYRMGNKWQGKSRWQYLYQLPWFNMNNADPDFLSTNTVAQKYVATTSAEYRMNDNWSANGGLQYYHQIGIIMHSGYTWSMNAKNKLDVNDVAAHGEINFRSRAGIFKLGGRIEKNSLSSILYSPRFAWNIVKGDFFFKVLVSNAFKIPTVQNVNLGPTDSKLINEKVETNEITFGYQSGQSTTIQITLFNSTINHPIVYVTDSIQFDNYINRGVCGSNGIEVRYNYISRKLLLQGGFSYYKPTSNSDVIEIATPGATNRSFLGVPVFKGVFSTKYFITERTSLNLSCTYLSSRYTYRTTDEESPEFVRQPSAFMCNIGCSYTFRKISNLQAQLGISNVLNQAYAVSSAYNNALNDLPIMARQLTIQVNYRLK